MKLKFYGSCVQNRYGDQSRGDPYGRGPPDDHYRRGPPRDGPYGRGPPGPDSYRGAGDQGPLSAGMGQNGSVLMCYGLNMEKINCQKLFNLFCLYGNVVRVS